MHSLQGLLKGAELALYPLAKSSLPFPCPIIPGREELLGFIEKYSFYGER